MAAPERCLVDAVRKPGTTNTEQAAPEDETGKATPPRTPSRWMLPWKSLDGLSHIEFLKISYVVLLLIPFVALVQHEVPQLPESLRRLPLVFRLLYFSSLFLSLAHMIYQGWCPPIIKRFDSPNDLYRAMLEIKALQTQYRSTDTEFAFDIKHCREGFVERNYANGFARLVCTAFYFVGGGLFLVVVTM
jgi:hypothetical protein